MGTGYPDVFAMGKFIKLYNYVLFSVCILCVSKMMFLIKRANACNSAGISSNLLFSVYSRQ